MGLACYPQQVTQVRTGSEQQGVQTGGVGRVARPGQAGCEGLEWGGHTASLGPADAGSWQALPSWTRLCC